MLYLRMTSSQARVTLPSPVMCTVGALTKCTVIKYHQSVENHRTQHNLELSDDDFEKYFSDDMFDVDSDGDSKLWRGVQLSL